VFFDIHDLPYEYEKEGFDMDGEQYLPDFWIPAWNVFVEIKREKPTKEEIRKAKRLHKKTGKKVLIFAGPPWPKEYSIKSFGLEHGYDGEFPEGHMELRQCRRCPNIMAVLIDDKDFIWSSMGLGHPNEDVE
jgi:hypothetical protein